MELQSSAAPLHGCIWPSGLHSPNDNRRENIFAAGAAAQRAFPRLQKSRRSSRRGYSSFMHAPPPQALLTPRPAAGAAHGVDDARAPDLP
mmetsp:Transcript_35618/g.80887  ORF Transcript_35618/g.80887 Transcript_35618/m.80887 type:complete len:90 (-) Transcript_35618:337-606(-)